MADILILVQILFVLNEAVRAIILSFFRSIIVASNVFDRILTFMKYIPGISQANLPLDLNDAIFLTLSENLMFLNFKVLFAATSVTVSE